MASFKAVDSIQDFQKFISSVYSIPDDRFYSISDILMQEQRFATRSLKGIRKNDLAKVRTNLLIAFSWLPTIANRFHIDVEEAVWTRFPMRCSYCGKLPCVCKSEKVTSRVRMRRNEKLRPKSLADFQKMFNEIYPPDNRTPVDAGLHLAEELGEVSEAIHLFLGQHLDSQFENIKLEIADLVSCMFGVANSLGINVAKELEKSFKNNCHVCHKAPCVCKYSTVASLQT